ncbi:MAG: hypothetical protein HZA49_01825 [Planctomycetes bacterium]|nr:hypothetical protein [Planctomycetota bacterium]
MMSDVKQGFWDKVRYAFATEDESKTVFSEEETALLNKVADAVVKRRLAAPALMFLESVRPLNFLSSQAMVFFQPIVSLAISTKEVELLAQILERRKSIPFLIELIEKREDEQRT